MSALYDIPTITVLERNWNRDINDFTTKATQVQVVVNTFQCSQLPFSCATVKLF